MTSLRAEFLIEAVVKAADTLRAEHDMTPRNAVINRTLTGLVQSLSEAYGADDEQTVLGDPRIAATRAGLLEKLSLAESEMEKFWADEFLSRPALAYEDLQDFWYWDCYDKLVDKEITCLPADTMAAGRRAVFIGAGALPLTAIILHRKTGMPVTCVDSDPAACRRAEALIEKLGITNMRVICADGTDLNYNRFDTVFVASLVPQPLKEEIIDEIRNSKTQTFVAVRSAERLHTLLYEPFDESAAVLSECRLIGRTDFDTQVINTTIVYHSPAGRRVSGPR